ncbi:MAG: ATP-dependent RecD-like DNA helicase, partial [Streptococcaceae bacterium]|nr:ATP-dependent RecD-like DNA helicase [Streptococcaceae bacterium]
MKETIIGKVEAIYFENPQNLYKVLRVQIEESKSGDLEGDIVVVGSFADISVEGEYEFSGDIVDHPKYGFQFKAEHYGQVKPSSESGLIRYLSGSRFPGIGKKTAERIVQTLGMNAIEDLMMDPEKLKQLNLSKKVSTSLVENLTLNYGMEKVTIALSEYGFGGELSQQILAKYKNRTLEIIQENPYLLAEEIKGIGFEKADMVAAHIGIRIDSEKRIESAILQMIQTSTYSEGNTFISAQSLLEETSSLLQKSRRGAVDLQKIAKSILTLVDEEKIQREDLDVFENTLYYAEHGIANKIDRMLNHAPVFTKTPQELDKLIEEVEAELEIQYDGIQKNAIKEAFANRFFILTGGPGTGKTTIIKGIVRLYSKITNLDESLGQDEDVSSILLAAPTGRAAKRMMEATGYSAGTIHRMLGLTLDGEEREEEVRSLVGGLLVVDEFSMVDTFLANMLFKAIHPEMHVIFVGDKDQLPSVGPGQVLHDLLQVEEIPKCELKQVFRQGGNSTIISLAHSIKDGVLPADFHTPQHDRVFKEANAVDVAKWVEFFVSKTIEKGYTIHDVHILSPMYKGAAGINNLNVLLQELFNSNADGRKREVEWFQKLRVGDKVMQLVNDSELNVFNGDFGVIKGIEWAREAEEREDIVIVGFERTEVRFKRSDAKKLTLSYATSIHKAQGSEFNIVILPLVHQFNRMLRRNLLYTGITRAKKSLILLGETNAFRQAVQFVDSNRSTRLKERFANLGYHMEEDLGTHTLSE